MQADTNRYRVQRLCSNSSEMELVFEGSVEELFAEFSRHLWPQPINQTRQDLDFRGGSWQGTAMFFVHRLVDGPGPVWVPCEDPRFSDSPRA